MLLALTCSPAEDVQLLAEEIADCLSRRNSVEESSSIDVMYLLSLLYLRSEIAERHLSST